MERLITPEELESAWGISRATQYDWRYRGTGPRSFKLGKYLRYRESDLREWLEAQASGPAKAAAG